MSIIDAKLTLIDAMNDLTEADTLERARFRMAQIFETFYDDEEGEPGQAIRDLLTDVLHEAEARGVNIHNAIGRATWMYHQECRDWAERGMKTTPTGADLKQFDPR